MMVIMLAAKLNHLNLEPSGVVAREGGGGGPPRAGLVRGGKRAKIVKKNIHMQIQTVSTCLPTLTHSLLRLTS